MMYTRLQVGGKETTSRNVWLDLLRVVLCATVVVYHYIPDRFAAGCVCVDGFFVLSGYLLAVGFERMKGRGGMDVRAFYESKARRLLPTLAASILMMVVYRIILHRRIFPVISGADFNFSSFILFYHVPAWYMVCEITFLGLAPVMYAIYDKGRKYLLLMFLTTALFSAYLYHYIPFASPYGSLLYFQPQSRLWQFVAGVVAYAVSSRLEFRPWMKTGSWILFGLFLATLLGLCFVKQDGDLHYINHTFPFDAAVVFVFMLLVPGLSKSASPQGPVVRQVLAKASALTYPMYLYHVPVWAYLGKLAGKLYPMGVGNLGLGLSAGVLTIILSILSLKYLDGFFAKKKPTTS